MLASAASQALAQVYRWQDEHGQIHFTDDPSDIPPRFRKQMETVALPEPTPPAAPEDVSWLDMVLGQSADAGAPAKASSRGPMHLALDEAVRAQWPDATGDQREQIVAAILDRLVVIVLALVVHTVATLAMFGHSVASRRPFWALGNLLVIFIPPLYALIKLETGALQKILILVGWATGPAAGLGLQFAIARILI